MLTTAAERAAAGKALRASVPRSAHADWEPPASRRDPVEWLEEQARTRIPELVPIRHGRMLASPFAFYRGGAAIMAADLAGTPRTGLAVQCSGDAHLSNFGLFATPERALAFDLNDFDETMAGPWEWDVKRLAASLSVAGRTNGFVGAERRRVVHAATEAYRTSMREYATMRNLDVWYSALHVREGLPGLAAVLDKKNLATARRIVDKARSKDSVQALESLTTLVDGVRRIRSEPPLVVPFEELLAPEHAARLRSEMTGLLRSYAQTLPRDRQHLLRTYRIVHMARKVVGVGSVGTSATILLLQGRDEADPLFLQAKQAQTSVLEAFVPASPYRHHGRRVVEGQRLMQAASDIFLGWDRLTGPDGVTRDLYVRQLRDWKGSWDPGTMSPAAMTVYGAMCAMALARAHARSGDRVAIAAYLGASAAFADAVVRFAESYADQNDRDHAALETAVREGRLTATLGV